MKKNVEGIRKYTGNLQMWMAAMALVLLCLAWPHRAMAASAPSITVKSVTSLNSTNAQINAAVSNPSKTKLTRCGFLLYNSSGKQLTDKYDKINYTLASFNAWFDLNSYYGKLTAGTTYKYKFYVMTSAGKYYYSALNSFKTSPAEVVPSGNYTSKVNSFIKNSKWANGIAWNAAQTPKLSPTSGKGCNAYVRDFVKYVFNKDTLSNGTKFTGTGSVKAGDVLYIKRQVYNSKTGKNETYVHWIAVLSRSGNKLNVAEGNASGKVRIGTNYSISGTQVKDTAWGINWTLNYGYRYQ